LLRSTGSQDADSGSIDPTSTSVILYAGAVGLKTKILIEEKLKTETE
jgi:hypothetical protein